MSVARSNEQLVILGDETAQRPSILSAFEKIIASHPPVLESLLLQISTPALLSLYHASKFLRFFLQSYPIAWRYLSFRLFGNGSNGLGSTLSSDDAVTLRSKPFALDQLLIGIVVPCGTRLCNLDLDNTAVSGQTLTSTILPSQRGTLQHLSVRGCKNVSLKYHIVPYLMIYSLQKAGTVFNSTPDVEKLSLKSLYAFRCRHHRRRPYFPSSLQRRDSDAEPTHELIKICHDLGIWTDTAWCPTPGGRCLRRKDFYAGRGTDSRAEVWVVYDRLWRSSNKIGRSESSNLKASKRQGLIWEEAELGEEGEPLGVGLEAGREGKATPAHLRRSHKVFIEGYKCHDCGARILERCEICSVRMHCMGCRKTLCASCAFSRPLPEKPVKPLVQDSSSSADSSPGQEDLFWWAPGETRSPNIMHETVNVNANPNANPKIKMQWCCLQPSYSGGGGFTFVSNGVEKDRASRLRTAPLPQGKGWEDPEFAQLRWNDDKFPRTSECRPQNHGCSFKEGREQALYWLMQGLGNDDDPDCSRNLCPQCYQTKGWQLACPFCHEPFCFQHDFRGLRMRICGYRDLSVEKTDIKEHENDSTSLYHFRVRQMFQAPEFSKLVLDTLSRKGGSKDSIFQEMASILPLPDDREEGKTGNESEGEDRNEPSAETTSASRKTPVVRLDIGLRDLGYAFKAVMAWSALIGLQDSSECQGLLEYLVMGIKEKSDFERQVLHWAGCLAVVCPEYRSVGDHRPSCPAVVKVCTRCDVFVCSGCIEKHPPCDCSYCAANYQCPYCYSVSGATTCKKTKEVEAARLLEIADRMADQAGEFLAAVTASEIVYDIAEGNINHASGETEENPVNI